MSRKSLMTTLVAMLAVAGLVTACGATTENPEAAGQQTNGAEQSPTGNESSDSGTGAEEPTDSGTTGESAQTDAGTSGDTSEATGDTTDSGDAEAAEPQPLDLNLPKDDALAAQVPQAIRDKGTLTIATDASYAPNEFLKNGQGDPIGMDIDLGNALAQVLGLDTEWHATSFDGILAGINAGRYDLSLSSFTDTKKREKVVNFVTYLNAGTSIIVTADNPHQVSSAEDLCGLRVGAEKGTTQEDMLTKDKVDYSVTKTCKDAGKPAPEYSGYPNQSDVNVALASGRLDAYMADTPVAEYAVLLQPDKFKKVGKDVGVAPYGIALPKKPAELTDVVQQAMQKLMDDGSYGKILDNWGLADAGISKSEVNVAVF